MDKEELTALGAAAKAALAAMPPGAAARAGLQKASAMIGATLHATAAGDDPCAASCKQIEAQLEKTKKVEARERTSGKAKRVKNRDRVAKKKQDRKKKPGNKK